MRNIAIWSLAALAVLGTGCSSVLSVDQIAGDETSNAALQGVWMGKGDDDPVIIQPGDKGALDIRCGDVRLVGRTFSVGEAEYLDVLPKPEEPFFVPAHAVIRYWLNGDSVRWAFVDSEWFRARIAEKGVPAKKANKVVVLTASGEAVRRLLAEHGQDPRAYSETNEMKRLQ